MKTLIFVSLLSVAASFPAPQSDVGPLPAPDTAQSGPVPMKQGANFQQSLIEHRDKIRGYLLHAIKSFIPKDSIEKWFNVS